MSASSRPPGSALVACVVFAALPAGAQTASPSPPTVIEYVEVTATRIPEDSERVAGAITVVTGEELRDRGATDLKSALALAAGIDIAPGGDGGPASSVPEIWGLKEFDAFLLVVDGVPWGGAFNPALASLDLGDIERIEVQRGPAPVMYGATSFVGVIHVVRHSATETKGSFSLGGGSYETGGGAFTASLPKWAGFDSRLSGDFARQGFKDDRTSFKRGHVVWRNQRTLANGAFRFDIDGTWLDQSPASPSPRTGAVLSPLVPVDANHNPDGSFLNERRIFVSTGYDRTLSLGSWSSTFSFTHGSRKMLRGFLTDVNHTPPNARGFREEIDQTDVYFDTHLAWTRKPEVRVVAGLDYLHGNASAEGSNFDYFVKLDGSNPPATPSLPAGDTAISDKRDFGGLYGYLEWTPSAAWRFEFGARLNLTHEGREEGDQREANPGETGNDRNVVRPSGAVGVTWTAWGRGNDRLRLFANYRNTFKPAAIDFGVGEGGAEGILEPETAQSYELGLKTGLADGRVSLQISGFLMEMRNLVIAQSIGGLPALANAGQERFQGIEGALVWRLAKGLTGRASYSLHDARFRDFLTEFDGVPTQLSGKRLEMSPHHRGAVGLTYAPESGLLFSAEANFVGERYLDKRNRALADSYATFSAQVGYRAKRWEVRLSGRNLNDERAAVSESELGDAQYYRLPARRFDLGATVRF